MGVKGGCCLVGNERFIVKYSKDEEERDMN